METVLLTWLGLTGLPGACSQQLPVSLVRRSQQLPASLILTGGGVSVVREVGVVPSPAALTGNYRSVLHTGQVLGLSLTLGLALRELLQDSRGSYQRVGRELGGRRRGSGTGEDGEAGIFEEELYSQEASHLKLLYCQPPGSPGSTVFPDLVLLVRPTLERDDVSLTSRGQQL